MKIFLIIFFVFIIVILNALIFAEYQKNKDTDMYLESVAYHARQVPEGVYVGFASTGSITTGADNNVYIDKCPMDKKQYPETGNYSTDTQTCKVVEFNGTIIENK